MCNHSCSPFKCKMLCVCVCMCVRVCVCVTDNAVRISATHLLSLLPSSRVSAHHASCSPPQTSVRFSLSGFLFQKWQGGKMMGKKWQTTCGSSAFLKKSAGKKKGRKEERNALVVGRVCSCSLGGLPFCHARSFPNQATKPPHHAQVQHAPSSSPPRCW